MARASSSLPVPVSPWISTVASVGRDGLNLLQHLAQARAFANDVFKAVLEIDLLFEILLLLGQPVAQLGNLPEDQRRC